MSLALGRYRKKIRISRSKHCFCHDKSDRRKNILNIKELINKTLDILRNNHATWFYLEFPQVNTEVLRQKIIAILKNKHGGLDIPDEEIEALADVILPGIIAFFSSEEGRAEFEAWKKERDLLLMQKSDKETHNGVA